MNAHDKKHWNCCKCTCFWCTNTRSILILTKYTKNVRNVFCTVEVHLNVWKYRQLSLPIAENEGICRVNQNVAKLIFPSFSASFTRKRTKNCRTIEKIVEFVTFSRKCFDFSVSTLSHFDHFEKLDPTGAVLYAGSKHFRASLDYAIQPKIGQKLFVQKFWGVPFSLPDRNLT